MAKSTETTTPDTPTSDRALPPGGSTVPTAAASPVPGPSGPDTGAGELDRPRPAVRGNGRPSDPAEMRREIERTRARMSSTLDAVEARIEHERDSLERKKDELVDRVTLKGVRDRLQREPWRTMAIAFVAGYVIAAIRD